PVRVRGTHPSDQLANLQVDNRPSRLTVPTFPSPIPAESPALPGDYGFGLDDEQRRAPVRPEARRPSPRTQVPGFKTKPATLGALQNVQLLAQGKVFQLPRPSSTKPRFG